MKEIGIMEVGGFKVGHAQNLEAGTGLTVILLDHMSPAGLDVRGGGPASRESQILNPLMTAEGINAVVLSGGSAFGLDAAGGVQPFAAVDIAAEFTGYGRIEVRGAQVFADRQTIQDVRIAYGVTGPIPMRVPTAEAAVRGKPLPGEERLLGRGVSYVCIYDANNGSITVE